MPSEKISFGNHVLFAGNAWKYRVPRKVNITL